MALQKTNLFCTKQNNIANTTFDLPKYTCNNSVKTKITFRKILAVQPLVAQSFDLATFTTMTELPQIRRKQLLGLTLKSNRLFETLIAVVNASICCRKRICCLEILCFLCAYKQLSKPCK